MNCREGEGPYDRLYEAAGILWPERPGRMVNMAAEILTPGRALDLGCGDGKNLLYLERLGWTVDGNEISKVALAALRKRMKLAGHRPRGTLRCADAVVDELGASTYDLVIAYGLYHCLDDRDVEIVHRRAVEAVRPGGMLAVAVLTSDLPVPEAHGTSTLHLRPREHLSRLVTGLEVVALQHGVIVEAHPPIVGTHEHAVTWGLFRKEG